MFLEIYTLPILSNLFFPKVDEQSRLAVRENFLLVFRTPFLDVNRGHIEIALPKQLVDDSGVDPLT